MNLSELIEQAEKDGADFKATLVPNDKYRCKVTHSNYKTSNAGNPGFGVRFEIIEGPYSGKGFWSNFYLTPVKKDGEKNTTGISIFFRQVAALGIATEEFKQGLSVEQAVPRFVGAIVDVTTVEDDYNKDEIKSKAKDIKKVEAQAAPAAPPAYVPPAPPVADAPSVTAPAVVVETPAPAPAGQSF